MWPTDSGVRLAQFLGWAAWQDVRQNRVLQSRHYQAVYCSDANGDSIRIVTVYNSKYEDSKDR